MKNIISKAIAFLMKSDKATDLIVNCKNATDVEIKTENALIV